VALEMLALHPYDAVLMDMQMPQMDGISATKRIREEARYRDLPIIAMTANAMQQDREKCLQAGMNDFVAKPIDPEILYNTLLKWITTGPAPSSSPGGPEHHNSAVTKGGDDVDIPVIHVELGLRHVLGKRPLYLKMLRKFASNQSQTLQTLKQALSAGDHGTAERLAHSAKSVAGNIGATDLQRCAEQLEGAIRGQAKPPEIEQHLAEFSRELSDLLIQLERTLPPEAPLAPQENFDSQRLAEVMIQLGDCLASDAPEAGELFELHRDLLQQGLNESSFKSLSQHISRYDFPEALKGLVAEATRLGIRLPSSAT